MSHGRWAPIDTDLCEMLPMVKVLPWLEPLLQEVQYLRNHRAEDDCETCDKLRETLRAVDANPEPDDWE